MTASLDPCLVSLVSRLRAMRDRYTAAEDDERGVPREIFDDAISFYETYPQAAAHLRQHASQLDTPVSSSLMSAAFVIEDAMVLHGDSLQWSMLRDNIIDIMLRAATLEAEGNRE